MFAPQEATRGISLPDIGYRQHAQYSSSADGGHRRIADIFSPAFGSMMPLFRRGLLSSIGHLTILLTCSTHRPVRPYG